MAGLLAFSGLGGSQPSPPAIETVPVASVAADPTIAIEEIRVGDRVAGSYSPGELAGETQVDPTTWRMLRLRSEHRWEDGTLDVMNVTTLQPPEWLAEHRPEVGATVPLPLDLLEMGLPEGLEATVVANEPCPAIQEGPGRVVLTTVDHLNDNVYELAFATAAGDSEAVQTTGLHKFYRPADDAWVSAQDLTEGDRLEGPDGPLVVQSLAKVPGTHRVYNMTVETEHVYRVSTLGALVHNNDCAQPLPDGRPPLQRIHPDETYRLDPEARQSLDYWRGRPTDEIVDSLKPGGKNPLTTKPDGRIYDGNTRIKALEERGFDINSLPRDELPPNPLDDIFND